MMKESRKKLKLVSQVSGGAWKEGGGVLKRGLGDVALLTAFLARVSTKLDLMACDTDDHRVARRRREGAMGKGETVGAPEDVESSSLRCSIVVVFLECADWRSEGEGD
jgi:hypothetical protein